MKIKHSRFSTDFDTTNHKAVPIAVNKNGKKYLGFVHKKMRKLYEYQTIENTFGGVHFGTYTAMHGDWLAISQQQNGTQVGKIHMYKLNQTTGLFQFNHTITSPLPAGGENWGAEIALHDDTLIVGAFTYQPASAGGRVYIYNYNPGSGLFELEYEASPNEADALYGRGVSAYGNKVVIGLPGSDVGGVTDAGKVFLHDWDGTTLQGPPDQILQTANAPTNNDHFGTSTAIYKNHLAVWTINYGGDVDPITGFVYPTTSGRVDIYDLAAGNTVIQSIYSPLPYQSAYFGHGLGMYEDTLVITECGPTDNSGPTNGKAFIYKWDNNIGYYVLVSEIVPSDGAAESDGTVRYGRGAAIYKNRLAIGASEIDGPNGEDAAGKVYIYNLDNESDNLLEYTDQETGILDTQSDNVLVTDIEIE